VRLCRQAYFFVIFGLVFCFRSRIRVNSAIFLSEKTSTNNKSAQAVRYYLTQEFFASAQRTTLRAYYLAQEFFAPNHFAISRTSCSI